MSDVRDVLRSQQRRCLPDLATIRILAVGAEAGSPDLADLVHHTVDAVLRGLRQAQTAVQEALAGTARGRSVARFLDCRRARLAALADDVLAAAARADLPALRRGLLRFHALATAMWEIQLGVCTPPARDEVPQPRRPRPVRAARPARLLAAG